MTEPTEQAEQAEQADLGNSLSEVSARQAEVRARTLAWIERFIVGLGLCPFARAPLEAGRVGIDVSLCTEAAELLTVLDERIDRLLTRPTRELETSLLVHPHCLLDFHDYNDFLGDVDALLDARSLDGILQVASFHPDYRFAGAPADDPANFSNRSPYPMLHLLRERSVDAAVDTHPDIEGIPERNIALLRGMPPTELEALVDGSE